jgi:hypothetical protein
MAIQIQIGSDKRVRLREVTYTDASDVSSLADSSATGTWALYSSDPLGAAPLGTGSIVYLSPGEFKIDLSSAIYAAIDPLTLNGNGYLVAVLQQSGVQKTFRSPVYFENPDAGHKPSCC